MICVDIADPEFTHPLHHADLRATLCRGNVRGRDESRDRGPAPGEHAVIHALEFFPHPETDIYFLGEKRFCRFKNMDDIKKSWDWSRLIHQGVKPFRVGTVTESESESSSIFGCTLPRGSRSWEGVMPPDDLGTMTRNCYWKYPLVI